MYKYRDTYKLMRKFYNLGTNEVRIMDYLMERDVAEITYIGLTKAIGLDVNNSSNIRKAVLHLQELGLVCIVNKHKEEECRSGYNPMKACFIVDNWMDNLLQAEI